MSSKINSKESVVFVPGALCSEEVFAHQVAGISPSFRTLFIDTIQAKTITEMAETLLTHAPSRFALVGISMGGYVALEVLRIAPDRVWGAVLISTTPRAETPSQSEERKGWIERIESGQCEDLIDEIVDACVSNNSTSNDARRCFREMVKTHSLDTFSRQMAASAMRPNFQEGLKDIRCPVLLISGSDDSEYFRNGVQEISESVISSEILILQNCGHLPTIESASSTTKAINQFLLRAAKCKS
ncbi:MAG: alpha/beta hydrolase [Oceanospirillaceae bacterium]|jgi:pimeloyl-ACP methyl ester carboxylesterase|nr:alpha/beta hydrolase [Oceanospirillaceae bacterium]